MGECRFATISFIPSANSFGCIIDFSLNSFHEQKLILNLNLSILAFHFLVVLIKRLFLNQLCISLEQFFALFVCILLLRRNISLSRYIVNFDVVCGQSGLQSLQFHIGIVGTDPCCRVTQRSHQSVSWVYVVPELHLYNYFKV